MWVVLENWYQDCDIKGLPQGDVGEFPSSNVKHGGSANCYSRSNTDVDLTNSTE
jgi:hypothetical protein